MREILFRGKTLDDNEWVYGGYFNGKSCYFDGDELVEENEVKHFIPQGIGAAFVKVDPKTVGQFTGLLDKNGKKIFEGDIIQVLLHKNKPKRDFIAYVLWDNASSGFRLSEHDYFIDTNSYGFEIIGNIHYNKELLK